ncbi:MAG TPA: alpha/beta hydrolase [Steroidobacteraceae bacterium]
MRRYSFIAVCIFLLGVLPGFLPGGNALADDCHVASYRLADGRALDLAPSSDGALRWRMEDGSTGELKQAGDEWRSTLGWTDRPDGHRVTLGTCESGEISFDGAHGKKIPLVITETRFEVEGAELAGRLLLPRGNAPVPLVVLVHGSEQASGRQIFTLQRQFPAAGIGAFVYDKRGTGDSTGTYTHDYPRLAADAAAAVREARRLAGRRASRTGLHGGSQGGWVAPLAATLTPVDFVIAAYGLAVSPLDEDREAVALDMSRHGFGADETRKALEVARAVEAIVKSSFQQGYAELAALRAKYSAEPWFRYLRGNVTGLLLTETEAFWKEKGPVFFAGILPDYDPMPVLEKLRTPQLWILGGDDIDAPPRETWRRLLKLKREGRPISAVMLQGAEHGMYTFELNEKGERVSLGLHPEYFRVMRDYIVGGHLEPSYRDAVVVR